MINPKARIIFWLAVIVLSFVSFSAIAQVIDFELNKEYDGLTVACKEKDDLEKFLVAESPKEYVAQDNSCFIGYTKFKMEKILQVRVVKNKTVNIVSGKVLGGYLQVGDSFVYSPFDTPDDVYFVVATKKGVVST